MSSKQIEKSRYRVGLDQQTVTNNRSWRAVSLAVSTVSPAQQYFRFIDKRCFDNTRSRDIFFPSLFSLFLFSSFFPPFFHRARSGPNRLVRRMICLPFSFLSSVAFTSIYYGPSFRASPFRARERADTKRQTVKCGWRDTAETEFCGAKINSVFACQFIANGRPGNS